MKRIYLSGYFAHFEIWPDVLCVTTDYGNDIRITANRPATHDNCQEASNQGYRGPNKCWNSLIDHELLHTIVSRLVFNCKSKVLLHESGNQFCTYCERLHEETLVLTVQHWFNTNKDLTKLIAEGALYRIVSELRDAKRRLEIA